MINIGGNPLMTILAIVAALGGVGLYFVRSFRPELARDHDIFFSAIALVYGIILLAFNFRMDITTQLSQVLVVGFAGWFAVESLILRQALSTQARRSPVNPIDDDPISPDYRAEIDPNREFAPRRTATPTNRRMRGSSPSSSRQTELRGDVEQERRQSSNGNRRPRRNPEPVIDIDEDDIRPVTPKQRRPRPERPDNNFDDNFSEWSSDQEQPSPRKRKKPTRNASSEMDEQDW